MLTGYVKKWDYSNGWGFIECDDDGYDSNRDTYINSEEEFTNI